MSYGVAVAGWVALGAAALGLWALSRRAPDRVAPPSALLRRLATGPVARVALAVVWMWAGWHLFAR